VGAASAAIHYDHTEMNRRSAGLALVCALAGACASSEGTYAPGCTAFAGSQVELRGGRFTWQKFTDTVLLDEERSVVNQFPGYPKTGTYRIDGQTVYLETDSGESMENMYLHRNGSRHLLLTGEQQRAWQESASYGDCVLTLDSM